MGLSERLRIFKDFDSGLKPTLLAAADIFVSPSDNLQETFGLAIIEAMAAGLPVVGPRLKRLWLELKRQAGQVGLPEATSSDVLGAGLAKIFAGFASGALEPGQVLDLAGLEPLLAALAARGGGVTLADLQADLAVRLSPVQVAHLVLWSLKYGLLRRVRA